MIKFYQKINNKTSLIPDLQNIVNQYLTPYDHYQLIDILFTREEYLKYRNVYEKYISDNIITDHENEIDQKFLQISNTYTHDPEYKEILEIMHQPSFDPNFDFLQQVYQLHKKYQGLLGSITQKYLELITKELKNTNLFLCTDLQPHFNFPTATNEVKICGSVIDNTFDTLGVPVMIEYDIYREDILIYEQNLVIQSYSLDQLSPLWSSIHEILHEYYRYKMEIVKILKL